MRYLPRNDVVATDFDRRGVRTQITCDILFHNDSSSYAGLCNISRERGSPVDPHVIEVGSSAEMVYSEYYIGFWEYKLVENIGLSTGSVRMATITHPNPAVGVKRPSLGDFSNYVRSGDILIDKRSRHQCTFTNSTREEKENPSPMTEYEQGRPGNIYPGHPPIEPGQHETQPSGKEHDF